MLDKNTLPWFSTEAERDRRFAEWVAAGNTMCNGLLCQVSGVVYKYRSGRWELL